MSLFVVYAQIEEYKQQRATITLVATNAVLYRLCTVWEECKPQHATTTAETKPDSMLMYHADNCLATIEGKSL